MTRKQWGIWTLSMLLFAILSIIALVVTVDPFQIYRRATFYRPPIENGTQNYYNAGLAKSYDYDSIVIGSSMTENFTPSQLDALLGGSFIKLPINGGTPYNHRQMMEMAFGTHDVQRVLYGVDVEALTNFYKTPKCEMPDYLYDDNLFNDVQYWFNKTVLARYIPKSLRNIGESPDDLVDTVYNWGAMYPYGKDVVLPQVNFPTEIVPQTLPETPTLSQASKLNVEYNFLPFIEAHPDTEFIFVFVPYSAARWAEFYALGTLAYHLEQKEALTQALLAYPNVRVFDFTARTQWITDLDNYIDAGHYGPWINDAMAECIARDEYRVTDAAQLRENDLLLLSLAQTIAERGGWPEEWPITN